MKGLLSSIRWEIVLQFRNGFYYATAFVLVFWLVLYFQLPDADLSAILPALLIGNLEITAFYFMAGLVMLEKEEGSLMARIVTPGSQVQYLVVKVLALSILVLSENLIVAALFSGFHFKVLPVMLGLFMAGAVFTLYNFLTVVRYDSINEYFFPSVLYAIPLALPLLDFFKLVQSPLFYLHPIQAALVLIKGGFQTLSALEWVYGIAYSLLSLLLLLWLGKRAFKKFVVSN